MSDLSSTSDGLLEFSKALANEKRQQILLGIFTDKQEHTVGEIAERVGIAPSTTSEHLAILKRAGVLVAEKRQKEVYYRVNKARVRELLAVIQRWLTCC
ncbi:MAG: metalloregulator ArsR/SmtB family transcription factor [Alcanivoracaceae bacterium]|nr:metalloregulator ArsR/SmtB family transcription factor [Alcanivoracaceae bacterium]